MTRTKLKGTGVALITPFTIDQKIDFPALERLINHCILGGVEYVVSLGTTGESATLSKEEKKAVLSFTVQTVNSRVPIVAGFGGNDTQQILNDFLDYDFQGIDAILSVSPYYNKPSQNGIIAHYTTIADAAPRPVILYNVPGRTGSNLTAETTITLSTHKNIIGTKEASGNLEQCMQIVKNTSPDFLKISGDDNLTLPLLALGFDGVISVSGQSFPKLFTEMVRLALRNEINAARQNHYKLYQLTMLLFAEGNPGGIKYVLEKLQICSEYMRLPLYPISEQLKHKIDQELAVLIS